MNMFGWTTYGWTKWGNPDWNGGPEETEARVYKHHTGLVVAIPVDTEGPFLVLSQMNRYLEDLQDTAANGETPVSEETDLPQRGGDTISMVDFMKFMASVRQPVPEHQHQWNVVGSRIIPSPSIHPRMEQIPARTLVLVKCQCGEPKSLNLEGSWTMQQLVTVIRIGSSSASAT